MGGEGEVKYTPVDNVNKKIRQQPANSFKCIRTSFTRFLKILDQWLYSFLNN